jgi:hypothetical protein
MPLTVDMSDTYPISALDQIRALSGGSLNIVGFNIDVAYTEDWQVPWPIYRDKA